VKYSLCARYYSQYNRAVTDGRIDGSCNQPRYDVSISSSSSIIIIYVPINIMTNRTTSALWTIWPDSKETKVALITHL